MQSEVTVTHINSQADIEGISHSDGKVSRKVKKIEVSSKSGRKNISQKDNTSHSKKMNINIDVKSKDISSGKIHVRSTKVKASSAESKKTKQTSMSSHKEHDEVTTVQLEKSRFCEHCELQFGTIRLHQKHMKSKHSDTYVETPEILTVSDDETGVKDDVLPRKCVVCKLKFANSQDLTKHMIDNHQKEQKFKKKKISSSVKKLNFSCLKCEAKSSEHTDYIEHVKSHDGKKKSGEPCGSTYNVKPHGTYCLKCEKNFKNPSLLKKHYEKAHLKDQKLCDKCGKSFASKYTLATHIDVEHHGKHFTCTYDDCDEVFKRKDQLSIHLMKHKGEATFICGACNKNFYHCNHFENHVNSHSNVRKYSCPKCG